MIEFFCKNNERREIINSVKGPDYSIFDFIGFEKMKRIIKIIMVFRTKFIHIHTNSHKILRKYTKMGQIR